jgi:cobalt/nickel transport protein
LKNYIKVLILIVVCLAFLIPFASSDPDGLERVAENLGVEETTSSSSGLMPDYTVPIVESNYFSTLIAGVIGVLLVLGAAFVLGKALTKNS